MRKIERRRKVSAHAEVSRNFSQSMANKILSQDRFKTNKNVKRERERGEGERLRERETGERGGESGRERERRQGNVYNSCSFCHNVFRKGGVHGETNSGMETVKIHIKTIE